jgi:hypothetical protein
MQIRVPLVFGKRDQRKYKKVIEWLESVDDGWKNDVIKEALLFYVERHNIDNLIEKKENVIAPEKIEIKAEQKKVNKENFDKKIESTIVSNDEDTEELSISFLDNN